MRGCQSQRKSQRRPLFKSCQRAEWEETRRRSENKSRRVEFNIFVSPPPPTLTKANLTLELTLRKSENMTNLIALAFLQHVSHYRGTHAEAGPRLRRRFDSGISEETASHLGRDKTRQDPAFQQETLDSYTPPLPETSAPRRSPSTEILHLYRRPKTTFVCHTRCISSACALN